MRFDVEQSTEQGGNPAFSFSFDDSYLSLISFAFDNLHANSQGSLASASPCSAPQLIKSP
jgi:hypothetical protein